METYFEQFSVFSGANLSKRKNYSTLNLFLIIFYEACPFQANFLAIWTKRMRSLWAMLILEQILIVSCFGVGF